MISLLYTHRCIVYDQSIGLGWYQWNAKYSNNVTLVYGIIIHTVCCDLMLERVMQKHSLSIVLASHDLVACA